MSIWQRQIKRTGYSVLRPDGTAVCPICNRNTRTMFSQSGAFVIKRTCRHYHERKLQCGHLVLVFWDGIYEDFDRELWETVKWLLRRFCALLSRR